MKTLYSTDGRELKRVSRWIELQHNYNPNKHNSLWDYVTDEMGYHPYQDDFKPENGLFLDYFRFNGRTYALEQFYLLNSFVINEKPIEFIENGEKHYITTVDMDGNIFNPLYAEWDVDCEHVRLYEVA